MGEARRRGSRRERKESAIARKKALLIEAMGGRDPESDKVRIPAHRDHPFRLNVTACSGPS